MDAKTCPEEWTIETNSLPIAFIGTTMDLNLNDSYTEQFLSKYNGTDVNIIMYEAASPRRPGGRSQYGSYLFIEYLLN